MRKCTACGETKPMSEYRVAPRYKGGHLPKCAECMRAAEAEYYTANKEKVLDAAYKSRLMRTYGLTLEDYDNILLAQDGVCAICGKTPEENGARLSVDHDHETGKVRGLLCHACNLGLGKLGDDLASLYRATRYLEDVNA